MFNDPTQNHRVIEVKSVASQAIGATAQTALDLWSNGHARDSILLVIVTDVGTGGTLDIVIADSPDDSTYDADWVTLSQITATGYYYARLADFSRYFRATGTVATDAVVWGAYLFTFDEQRRKVTQSGTALTITYGTGRSGRVATS